MILYRVLIIFVGPLLGALWALSYKETLYYMCFVHVTYACVPPLVRLHCSDRDALDNTDYLIIVLLLNFFSRDYFIRQCYQDLIAIVCKYSHLSLFITFTANPKWDKITYKLLPKQIAIDRPNLVIRVFYIKVTHLLYNLKRKQIFSRYYGYI